MNVLTVKDLCATLKLGKHQAYALMNSKAFPSYRIGSKYFVTEEALKEWLKKIEGKKIFV